MAVCRELFCDSDRCGHWNFQVKGDSKYWQLILGNVMGLGGEPEAVHMVERSRILHQDLLSPLGMQAE